VDAAVFADQVCKVLLDNAEDVAAAARRRVVSDYSWENNLKRFEALLEGTSPGYEDDNGTAAINPLTENIVSFPRGTSVPPKGSGTG